MPYRRLKAVNCDSHHVTDAPRICRPQSNFASHPPTDPPLSARQVQGRVAKCRHHAVSCVPTRLFCLMSHNCVIDHSLEIDLRSWRCISIEVLIHLCHPHLADAISDRVVNHRPQRTTTPFEPADEDKPPQRTRSVKRFRVELCSKVEELPVGPRHGKHNFTDVRVDVEFRVGNPRRGRNPTKARHGALIEARGARYSGTHLAHEPSAVDRLIEQSYRSATWIKPWVLFDTPHERLVLAHPVGVVDFSFSCGHCDVSSRCRGVSRSGSGEDQVSVPGRRSDSASGSPL